MWIARCYDLDEYHDAALYYLDIEGNTLSEIVQEILQDLSTNEFVKEIKLIPWHNTSPEFFFNEMAYAAAIILTNLKEVTVERSQERE